MARAQEDRITPLMNEHKGIARQLDLLRKAIGESERPSPRGLCESIDHLASLVETHFDREESSLYKPLKLRLGRDNPVDSMAREHRSIRRTLGGLVSASAEYKADRSGLPGVQSRFDSLQREMGEHMEKEEQVLFWLADLKL